MSKRKAGKESSSRKVNAWGPDENLERLSRTGILMDFVEKRNGNWGHEEWLTLCRHIEEKGFTPIDFDQVGLRLEDQKRMYLSGE